MDRLAERTEYARISHVDTTTAVSASASVTINRPAGTQPDDVIVALISAALVPPALSIGAIAASGWNVLADRTNLNGRTFVLWRQATATDPASWTFTASGSRLAGALSSYRNVDPRRSITAVGAASTSTATSHPFPQVTAGTDAQHLVHVAGFAPNGVNPTTPAGTTERAKITNGPALLVVDRYQSHPGTAPVVAATTGLPNSSVVATIALAPKVTTGTAQIRHIATTDNVANADTITISRPAGTQAGDTIIASISGQGAITPGNLTAAGWSLIADRASTGVGASARTYVLTRYATGSDPGSWSFTAPNATNLTGALSTYRGPAGGWPITAVNATATASATSHPFPQVTVGYGGHHLVHVMGVEANTASAAPAGTTQRASRSTGIGALGSSIVVADRALPSTGTSTVVNGTTATAAPSMTLTIALAPAITAARYSYSGHNDNPEHVLDVGGSVIERNVALPGSTTYTTTPTGATYSHANAHGDTVTITDPTGQRIWTGHNGPYGEQPAPAGANTTIPNTAWGWHGQQSRLTDGEVIHLGARPYSPGLGRFLSVDPVEGGCANDYTYVEGDPLQESDLSGRFKCPWGVKGAAQILGWRFLIDGVANDTLFTRSTIEGGKGTAAILVLSQLTIKPSFWREPQPSLFRRALGGVGRVASFLGKAEVGILATAVDYACE